MLDETEKAKAKAEREAAWWAKWWAKDFSWDGLAKLGEDGEPEKPWIGWSVTAQHRLVETASAPDGARPASLQDYFCRDPATGKLRTPRAMRAAGLVVGGEPAFHILHLPPRYADGSESWKSGLQAPDWARVEAEAERLVAAGAERKFVPTDDAEGDISKIGLRESADRRAQMQGAVLRAFPRPPEPILHLTADFAAFLGDCHAGRLDFGSIAGFANSGFFGTADFGATKFSGGGADFISANFSGGVADFRCARFSHGPASFREAQFSGGDSMFERAKFCGGARFNRARFSGGDAIFSNAKFSDIWTDFENAQFTGGIANFEEVEFSSAVSNFYGAIFEEAFYAQDAKFLGRALFQHARFEGRALFGDADHADWSVETVRGGTVFRDKMSFRGAVFNSLADFARCRFPDRADHRNAAFEGARFFESLDFKGVERLPFSAFQGALLDKGILIGPEHPIEVQFKDAIEDARRAPVHDVEVKRATPNYSRESDADFENRTADARFAALEAGCRVLKHAMAQTSDRQREQAFFTMEMRARGRRDPEKWVNNTLTGFYGLFSDYGGAVFRPLLAAFALAGIFAVMFVAVVFAFGYTSNPALTEGWTFGWDLPVHSALANSIALAAKNMLGPLGHLFSDETPFAYAGTCHRFWFNAVLGLLSVVQTIPSLILLFLSGLALRRQFQIN